jgi:hypothetical protein
MYGKWIWAVILLICFSSSLLCQSSDNAVAERKLSIGVNVFFYHPNIGDLNSGFSRAEQSLGLYSWSDFKIYYIAMPTVAYAINSKMRVAIEGGGSYVRRIREESRSFYGVWMIGGKYMYMPLAWNKPPAELWVSVGAGFIEGEFFRSYANDIGISAVARRMYVDGGVQGRMAINRRTDVLVDLRYLYVPPITFGDLHSKLKLNAFAAGVGIVYTL